MRNIWTVGFHKLFIQASEKMVDHVEKMIVEVGDMIMVRLIYRIGTPFWIEALLEICQGDKCQSKNIFTITWDNKGEVRSSSRLVGQYNRGFGR